MLEECCCANRIGSEKNEGTELKIILGTDPIRFPLTGIGRYTYELARNMQANVKVDELVFFNRRKISKYLPENSIVTNPINGVRFGSLKKSIQKVGFLADIYRVTNPILQYRALRNFSEYIYHGPNFYLPRFSGLKVATFHDLSPFTWSHCHPPERVRFMQKELLRTVRSADVLITDSEHTRIELAKYFNLPLNKIQSVPLAASPEFGVRSESECLSVLKKYNLGYRHFSLYVGTIEPRKNIEGLLEAYKKLPLRLRTRFPLVLSGYQGWNSDAIHTKIRKAIEEGWATYLGFVPASDLPLLFSSAALFTFPSYYEGFGLPVLESMASGTPVVCSNSSSLPEVAGDTALTCGPNDINCLADSIERGLEDNIWRDFAIEKGISRAAEFSWHRCAEMTVAVYDQMLKTG